MRIIPSSLPVLLALLFVGLVLPLTAQALPEIPPDAARCVMQNSHYGPSGRSVAGMDQFQVYVFFRCHDASNPITAVRMVEGYGKTLATREIASNRRCQLTSSSMGGSLITEGPRFVGEPEPDYFTLSYQADIQCRPHRHKVIRTSFHPHRVHAMHRMKVSVKTIDKPETKKPQIEQVPAYSPPAFSQKPVWSQPGPGPGTSPLPTGHYGP